eukprot:TRINITY_DN2279_c0_g2_i1.p1 TRINITY_DN2279_c0_g2~~TRINITY_DN2279_c0_g2_i1.p1  ORF type:complete len:430 (-),score=78.31 TRINITY_DN2279_c0_g2_i1:83-1198(-)
MFLHSGTPPSARHVLPIQQAVFSRQLTPGAFSSGPGTPASADAFSRQTTPGFPPQVWGGYTSRHTLPAPARGGMVFGQATGGSLELPVKQGMVHGRASLQHAPGRGEEHGRASLQGSSRPEATQSSGDTMHVREGSSAPPVTEDSQESEKQQLKEAVVQLEKAAVEQASLRQQMEQKVQELVQEVGVMREEKLQAGARENHLQEQVVGLSLELSKEKAAMQKFIQELEKMKSTTEEIQSSESKCSDEVSCLQGSMSAAIATASDRLDELLSSGAELSASLAGKSVRSRLDELLSSGAAISASLAGKTAFSRMLQLAFKTQSLDDPDPEAEPTPREYLKQMPLDQYMKIHGHGDTGPMSFKQVVVKLNSQNF